MGVPPPNHRIAQIPTTLSQKRDLVKARGRSHFTRTEVLLVRLGNTEGGVVAPHKWGKTGTEDRREEQNLRERLRRKGHGGVF